MTCSLFLLRLKLTPAAATGSFAPQARRRNRLLVLRSHPAAAAGAAGWLTAGPTGSGPNISQIFKHSHVTGGSLKLGPGILSGVVT